MKWEDPESFCLCCPLRECDQYSVLCLRALFSQPNHAQRKEIEREDALTKKKRYQRAYDLERREEKREYDRQRYLAKVRAMRLKADTGQQVGSV